MRSYRRSGLQTFNRAQKATFRASTRGGAAQVATRVLEADTIRAAAAADVTMEVAPVVGIRYCISITAVIVMQVGLAGGIKGIMMAAAPVVNRVAGAVATPVATVTSLRHHDLGRGTTSTAMPLCHFRYGSYPFPLTPQYPFHLIGQNYGVGGENTPLGEHESSD